MRKILMAFCAAGLLLTSAVHAEEEHALFTEILSRHVTEGLVDYEGLCTDIRLQEYVDQLAVRDPAALKSRPAQLAFWINAYNAFTLKIVCDRYPIKSINQLHDGGLVLGTMFKKTVWDKPLVTIGGQTTTLNAVEHDILRKQFKEARIHFALVCAALSCPPLRSEAYEGDRVNEQLTEQARIFLSDTDKNYFDPDKKKAYLSPIFGWFAGDFGGKANVLNFLGPLLPEDIATEVQDHHESWTVRYTKYDWRLNDSNLLE